VIRQLRQLLISRVLPFEGKRRYATVILLGTLWLISLSWFSSRKCPQLPCKYFYYLLCSIDKGIARQTLILTWTDCLDGRPQRKIGLPITISCIWMDHLSVRLDYQVSFHVSCVSLANNRQIQNGEGRGILSFDHVLPASSHVKGTTTTTTIENSGCRKEGAKLSTLFFCVRLVDLRLFMYAKQ